MSPSKVLAMAPYVRKRRLQRRLSLAIARWICDDRFTQTNTD